MSSSHANVAITFPDLSPAEASIIAQELATALAEDGVPPGSISRARANPDAQDLGSVVQVLADTGIFEVVLEIAKDATTEFAKGGREQGRQPCYANVAPKMGHTG